MLATHAIKRNRKRIRVTQTNKITQPTIRILSPTIEIDCFIKGLIRTRFLNTRCESIFLLFFIINHQKVDLGKASGPNRHRSSRHLAVNKSVIALVPQPPPTPSVMRPQPIAASGPTFNFHRNNNNNYTSWPKFSVWWARKATAVAKTFTPQCAWPPAHDSKQRETKENQNKTTKGWYYTDKSKDVRAVEKRNADDHSQRWWILKGHTHNKKKESWTLELPARVTSLPEPPSLVIVTGEVLLRIRQKWRIAEGEPETTEGKNCLN